MFLAVALGAVAIGVGPATAHRDGHGIPGPVKVAKAVCKAQAKADPEAFLEKYGPREGALRRCVVDKLQRAAAAIRKAAGECGDERALDPEAFREKYGAGENDRYAFVRCVGSKLRERIHSS